MCSTTRPHSSQHSLIGLLWTQASTTGARAATSRAWTGREAHIRRRQLHIPPDPKTFTSLPATGQGQRTHLIFQRTHINPPRLVLTHIRFTSPPSLHSHAVPRSTFAFRRSELCSSSGGGLCYHHQADHRADQNCNILVHCDRDCLSDHG